MIAATRNRLGLSAAVAVGLFPALFAPAVEPPSDAKLQYFTGKVAPLTALLAKSNVRLDADAAASWYALAGDDGKVYPLIKDDGSRMFFRDDRLLNRPMRLNGKLFPQSQLLQVVAVHSLLDGKLHDVYYWCDICAIKRYEKKICDCCGGPMELREVPVK
jgi:hypothetical protein